MLNAQIWLDSHIYTTNNIGEITIPFTTQAVNSQIIVASDTQLSIIANFSHLGENYDVFSGYYLNPASLLPNSQVALLIRPKVILNSLVNVPIALCKSFQLNIKFKTNDSKFDNSYPLDPRDAIDSEIVQMIKIPLFTTSISCTVSCIAPNKTRLTSTPSELRIREKANQIFDFYLHATGSGYRLLLLGKIGECYPNIKVTITLTIRYRTCRHKTEHLTDANGCIELGQLKNVVSLECWAEDKTRCWALEPSLGPFCDNQSQPSQIYATTDDAIELPFAPQVIKKSFAKYPHHIYRLIEGEKNNCIKDWSDKLTVSKDRLVIPASSIPEGRYTLLNRVAVSSVSIVVVDGKRTKIMDNYLLSKKLFLEYNPLFCRSPWISETTFTDAGIQLAVSNYTPNTRIHLFFSQFVPSSHPHLSLVSVPRPTLASYTLSSFDSCYVSGRELGDEYRYIIDRKKEKKFCNVFIPTPTLQVSPFEVHQSDDSIGFAVQGGNFENKKSNTAQQVEKPRMNTHFNYVFTVNSCSADFIADESPSFINLKPDMEGNIFIKSEDYAKFPGRYIQMIIVDSDFVDIKNTQLPVPAPPLILNPSKFHQLAKSLPLVVNSQRSVLTLAFF